MRGFAIFVRVISVFSYAGAVERKDSGGGLIIYLSLHNPDASKYDFVECIKAIYMIVRAYILENGVQSEMILVIDQKDVTLGHVMKLPLPFLKKINYFEKVRNLEFSKIPFRGFAVGTSAHGCTDLPPVSLPPSANPFHTPRIKPHEERCDNLFPRCALIRGMHKTSNADWWDARVTRWLRLSNFAPPPLPALTRFLLPRTISRSSSLLPTVNASLACGRRAVNKWGFPITSLVLCCFLFC